MEASNTLNYKPDSEDSDCKCSRNFGIWATHHETLLAVFRQHNEDYEKQVGKLKSLRSYLKYCTVYNHLAEFIEKRYKVSDIALKELAPAFITDFELFLKTEKNHCTIRSGRI